MSGRGRQVKIEILGDARDAQQAFDALEKSSGGLVDKLKGVASIASGFIVAEGLMRLPGLMSAATDEAIRLESNARKASVVFGDELGTVQAWAEDAAAGMGLTNDQAVALAAGMGDLLVPMGFTREEAAAMSTDVTDLAGALSEWSGGQRSASEVSEILTSAMLGERDALKGLGISISQAEVDARVLENTQKGLTFATEEQAAAVATQQLIMEKSTDAQTAYAESQDDMASKQARLTARSQEFREKLVKLVTPAIQAWQDILLTVGETILNRVEPALDDLSEFVEDFVKGPLKDLIEGFGDLVDEARDLGDRVGDALGDVRGEVSDFVASLRDGISLSDLTSGLTGIGGAIVDTIGSSLASVDWSGIRAQISSGMAVGFSFATDQAQALVDGIADAFIGVDWTAVRTEIQNGVLGGLQFGAGAATGAGEQIQAWIVSEVQAVEDWAEVGRALKSGIISGIAVASGGAALAIGLVDWILTSLQENEGDVRAVATDIAGKIAAGFEQAVSIAEDLAGWIKRSVEEIDWTAAANALSAGMSAALVGTPALAQGVADSISGHIEDIDWSGLHWDSASTGMTAGLGDALRTRFTEIFGEIDLEAIVRDSGLVLTPEALFGEGGLTEELQEINDSLSDIAQVLREELGPTLRDAREMWEEWEPILRPLLGLLFDIGLAIQIEVIKFALQPLILTLQGTSLAIEAFSEWVRFGMDRITEFGERINEFTATAETIYGWSEDAIGSVTNWADTSIQKSGEFLDGMLGNIDEMALSGAETLGGFVEGSAAALAGWVTASATKAGEFLSAMLEKLSSLVVEGAQKADEFVAAAVGVFATLPGRVTSAIGDLSGIGAEIASNFVSGMIGMLTSSETWSRLYSAGYDLAENMVQGAWDAIRPGSPSKEGREIGRNFVEGVVAESEDQQPTLYAAGENVIKAIIVAVNEMTKELVEAIDEMTAAIVAAIEAGYPALQEAGKGAGESVTDGVTEGMARGAGKAPKTPPKQSGAAMGKDFGEGVAEGVEGTEDDVREGARPVGVGVAEGTEEGMARGAGALPQSPPQRSGAAMGRGFGEGVAEGIEDTEDDVREGAHPVGVAAAEGVDAGLGSGAIRGTPGPGPRGAGRIRGREFGEGIIEGVEEMAPGAYDEGYDVGESIAIGAEGGFAENFDPKIPEFPDLTKTPGNTLTPGGTIIPETPTPGEPTGTGGGEPVGVANPDNVIMAGSGIVTNSDLPQTGPEFTFSATALFGGGTNIYRVSDAEDPELLIRFMAKAHSRGSNVYYSGGKYGLKGGRPPGYWANQIINSVTSSAGNVAGNNLENFAEGLGLQLSGPNVISTNANNPAAKNDIQAQQHGSGAGGAGGAPPINLVVNLGNEQLVQKVFDAPLAGLSFNVGTP